MSFGIAESWKPKAVKIDPDEPLAELAMRGPLTLVCEIDAKPAGSLGFLRVWTGPPGDLRTSLTDLITQYGQETVFTDLRIGDRPALEVVYQFKDPYYGTSKPERALIVQTGEGVAAISLDTVDADEHAAMLPAYELAKATLAVTG